MDEKEEKINQSQFFDLITGQELSWQAIIYDLIRTEQLDPWDIDIKILTEKYLEIIEKLEEANFFISSKVLLACSLLLRLKSEILINSYIKSFDDELYGKEDKKYALERIEIDESEIPFLVPRTPLPRYKKVTLKDLMASLNKAIETENRRIKREIKSKQAEKSALVVLPKKNRIPLKNRVKELFQKIRDYLSHAEEVKMSYADLAPSKEEKLLAFLPVLHLSHQEKIWLQQEEHFGDIYITLEKLEEEFEELIKEVSHQENIDIKEK
jgi:segregation and condensation protein A